jgi:hypothetical protein
MKRAALLPITPEPEPWFHRPQVFRISGVYALPFQNNIFVRGWQVSGNLLVQSGPPWNVDIGFDQAGNAVGAQRPNLVMPLGEISEHNINQWVNPDGFSLPAPGTLGNLQRDFLAGPGIVNFDFSAIKDTPIRENVHLQFRAEFFNIFNHANFALPNPNVFLQGPGGTATVNPTFGQITATSTAAREIQFALKLMF